jgi:drug/metabolite transporter (DMT)-like permease
MSAAALGVVAGLTTSLCWSWTSLFFAAAGRRIGAFQVNQVRVVMALVLLAGACTLAYGSPIPDLPRGSGAVTSMALLFVSGIVGLLLGDTGFFSALVHLGPKLAALMLSTWPVFAALLGWIFLGETLKLQTILGIAITLAGVMTALGGAPRRCGTEFGRGCGRGWRGGCSAPPPRPAACAGQTGVVRSGRRRPGRHG